MKAKVLVTLKEGILDPQGTTITKALTSLGYENVGDVRVGKVIELTLDHTDEQAAREQVEEMCRRLLANTVIESYRFEVES